MISVTTHPKESNYPNLTFGKLHLSSYIPDIMNRDCSNLLLFLELFKPSLQFFLFLCNLNDINDHKYIIIFIITISSQSEESHWKTSQSRSTIAITVTSLIIRTADVHNHHIVTSTSQQWCSPSSRPSFPSSESQIFIKLLPHNQLNDVHYQPGNLFLDHAHNIHHYHLFCTSKATVFIIVTLIAFSLLNKILSLRSSLHRLEFFTFCEDQNF